MLEFIFSDDSKSASFYEGLAQNLFKDPIVTFGPFYYEVIYLCFLAIGFESLKIDFFDFEVWKSFFGKFL